MMRLHFRIGDAAECGGGGDGNACYKGKDRVAKNRRDGKPRRDFPEAPVDGDIDVGDRPGSSYKLAHQHEQRDHSKGKVPQCLRRRRCDRCFDNLRFACDHVDADKAGHTQSDGNVNAEKYKADQQRDDQGSRSKIEHSEIHLFDAQVKNFDNGQQHIVKTGEPRAEYNHPAGRPDGNAQGPFTIKLPIFK